MQGLQRFGELRCGQFVTSIVCGTAMQCGADSGKPYENKLFVID